MTEQHCGRGDGARQLQRRQLLLGAAASAAGLVTLAGCNVMPGSAPKKPPLIGFLTNVTDSAGPDGPAQGFLQGLREHGLVEGDNLRIEWRSADGDDDRLPGLAAELVSLGVQVIATTGGAPSTVAGETTDRVPIVVMGGGALVERGLAASMSRPDIQSQADLEPAFERAAAWGADMLSPHNVVPLNTPRALLPTLALRYRLPGASQNTAWTEAGLLLAYSGSLWQAGYRSAAYVARILNGASPAELPIELTTVFDLVINRRTLEHWGLTVPPHVASQVTRWVE